MTKYLMIDDGNCRETIEADTLEAAVDELRDWMLSADFDTSSGPVYYDADLYEVGIDADGDETTELVHRETMEFEQDEPNCTHDGGHDWQSPYEIVGGIKENPGVWGHGGGVIINECCMHCGCKRTTDTWAQRMDTGEQGLREVTYDEGYYADALAARAEEG